MGISELKFEGLCSILFNTIWCNIFFPFVLENSVGYQRQNIFTKAKLFVINGYLVVELSHNYFGVVRIVFSWSYSFCQTKRKIQDICILPFWHGNF